MKNLLLMLFVLISIKASSQELQTVVIPEYFQSPQQVSIFENIPSQPINMKCIIGDYWGRANVFSSAVSFDKYCFFTDGTFKHRNGYSGGVYFVSTFEGKYKIDEKNNTINLTVKNVSSGGHLEPAKKSKKHDLHTSIKILGINDTIVETQVGADTMVYYRTPGCMKAWTWGFAKKYTKKYQNNECEIGENDWEHRIEFQDFGQFVYTAENTWRKYKKFTFAGGYHLQDNIIYLEIRSKSIYDSNIGIDSGQQFEPEKHTYIRVDIEKGRVNLSDLEDLLNDNIGEKSWVYSSCEFKIEQPIPDSVNDEWVVMAPIKKEED